MESISELRKLLQEEKVNPQGWSRPWGYRTFQRGPSIYITRLLLSTRITPNTVTTTSIACGLLGCLLILPNGWSIKIVGLALLYANTLFDRVDGEIARYKKIFSLRGVYWDEINHLVIPPLFWISLVFSLGKLPIFKPEVLFLFGTGGALALAVNRITHSLAPQIFAKKFLKNRELFLGAVNAIPSAPWIPSQIVSGIRLFFKAIHHLQDFFIIIASTAVVIVLERYLVLDYVFHPLLNYFVFTLSILFILFAFENIVRKSLTVEREIFTLAQTK